MPSLAMALSWSQQSLWSSTQLLQPGQTETQVLLQMQSTDQIFSKNGETSQLGSQSRQTKSNQSGDFTRSYQVELQQMRFTPQWSYGLSRTWTVAARLPVINMSAKIKQNIQDQGGSIRNDLKPSFTEKSKSSRYYDVNDQEELVRIGQFEVRSKHSVYAGEKYKFVMFETLKLPTSETESLDYLVYTELPAQNVAASIGSNLERSFGRKISVNLISEVIGYTQDEVYAKKSDGFLTSEKIGRNPGHELLTDIAGAFRGTVVPVLMKLGYRYQYQAESRYDESDDMLADSFEQEKKSMYMALAWQPPRDQWSRNDSPVRAHIEWENTLSGINTQKADTISLGVSSAF